MHNITPARSYRAILIPKDVSADQAEAQALQGALPILQFKAPNNATAARIAHAISGRPVLEVVRVEVPA